MNKQELIAAVAKESGQAANMVRAILDATDNVVRRAVGAGDEVFLFGLGKVFTKRRGKTVASNFGKSKPIVVPERNLVQFQPSSGLKQAVNQK